MPHVRRQPGEAPETRSYARLAYIAAKGCQLDKEFSIKRGFLMKKMRLDKG